MDLLLLAAAAGGAYYWFVVREQPAASPSSASTGTAVPEPAKIPDFRQYKNVGELRSDFVSTAKKLGQEIPPNQHYSEYDLQQWNKFQQKFNVYTMQEQPQYVNQMNEMSPAEMQALLFDANDPSVGAKLGFQGAYVQHVKDYFKNIMLPEMMQGHSMGVGEEETRDTVDT